MPKKEKTSQPKRVIGIDPSMCWTGCADLLLSHDLGVPLEEFSLSHVHVKWLHGYCERTEDVPSSVREAQEYIMQRRPHGLMWADEFYIEEVPPTSFHGNAYCQQCGVYWALRIYTTARKVSNSTAKSLFDIPQRHVQRAKKALMIEAVKEKVNDEQFNTYLTGLRRAEQREGICDAIATAIAGYFVQVTDELDDALEE